MTTLRYCGLGALGGDDDLSLHRSAAGHASPLRLRGSIDARLASGQAAGLGDDMFRVDTATRWIDEADLEPAELAEAIVELRKRGWRATLHASSPDAIDLALEAFSTAANAGTPLGVADGLEHRAALSAEASARLRSLGLSAGLLIEDGSKPSDVTVNLDSAAAVSVSVDQMAGPPAPLRALASIARFAGFERRGGDRLQVVTCDASNRCNVGPITGRLEVGMYADFAFLDQDPRKVVSEDFGRLRCVGTWVSGREIHP